MLPSFKNKKGFTLIEILIVVLVLGILTVAGITSYVNSTGTFSFIAAYKQVMSSLRTARSYALADKDANGIIPEGYVVKISEQEVKTYADIGDIPILDDENDFIIKNYTFTDYIIMPEYARTGDPITPLPLFISYQTGTGAVTIMDSSNTIIEKGANKYIVISVKEGDVREKFIVLFQVSGLPEEFDSLASSAL